MKKQLWVGAFGVIFFGMVALGHDAPHKLELDKPTTIRVPNFISNPVHVIIIKLSEPEGYLILTSDNAGTRQEFIRGWDNSEAQQTQHRYWHIQKRLKEKGSR